MDSSLQTTERVVILGAGGHGRVVLDILLAQQRYTVAGFLDNNRDLLGRRIDGIPVIGTIEAAAEVCERHNAASVIVAIGDNGARRGIARQLEQAGLRLLSAIHPTAAVARNATIGRNVVIAAGVVVCAHCQVGDSVILNTGCIVDHQTMIGEGSHICPGVRIAGRVVVEPGTFVGIGATIVPRVTVGCEAVVGAGSVVLEDVPPMATVVGVPAKPIRLATADEDTFAMVAPAPAGHD